jgi:hypothetical protein
MTYTAEATATGTLHDGTPVEVVLGCENKHLTRRGALRCAARHQAEIAEGTPGLELTFTRAAIAKDGTRHTA